MFPNCIPCVTPPLLSEWFMEQGGLRGGKVLPGPEVETHMNKKKKKMAAAAELKVLEESPLLCCHGDRLIDSDGEAFVRYHCISSC